MSWGGSGPLGGGPFGGGGGSSAGPDPFGGATEFGFSIPQGDPGQIEQAARACTMRSFALTSQSGNVGSGMKAAVAGWEGGAQAAFADYAGHVIKVLSANAEAFGDAAGAMTTLSQDLEHAQQVTRQAAKECATYQNALTTAQGDVTQHSATARTLSQQAANAYHPQMQGELNRQAGIEQAAADAAAKAADKAGGQLKIWQGKGKDADRTYQHHAQASTNKINAAAGRIQTVPSLPGGAPVPINVTPGDVALAQSMLSAAGSLPAAAEAIGDPRQLSRLAGGKQLSPGTILSYMNQGAAEARKQESAGKGSLVDAAGGLAHTLSLGAVSFGNPDTGRYRGGEAAGLIPIDPESLGLDAEKLGAKVVEHEGEKEGERVAAGGAGAATGAKGAKGAEGAASTAEGAESLGSLYADGHVPTEAQLREYAESHGWTLEQTPTGPAKYVDQNGVPRLTIKSGSARTPGSEGPHVEIRNGAGQRTDPYGNPVTRRSPGNHTPYTP